MSTLTNVQISWARNKKDHIRKQTLKRQTLYPKVKHKIDFVNRKKSTILNETLTIVKLSLKTGGYCSSTDNTNLDRWILFFDG